MRAVDCVGVLIQDEQHRVYVQRRTMQRRLFPGIWDIVGGHVERGETPEQTLARELEEETGWKLREIRSTVADWEWKHQRRTRRELDYLVTVEGDLRQPRLEEGKHDAGAWVGPDDLDLLMQNRTDGDRRVRDIVAHVVRTRFTERLRLEPVAGPGEVLPGHAADLERWFADPLVARWYAATWSQEKSVPRSAAMHRSWEEDGVSKWTAYDRASGSLVGRGGLSRLGANLDVTASIASLVGPEWAVDRLDLGWALTKSARGEGYEAEIGRAGLEFAFETLGASAVIAFTERHNVPSRLVMDHLGMSFVGEITTEGLVAGMEGMQPDEPFAVYALVR
jgi:RimJ/RimL family protein N-acetyltransferase